MQEIHRYRIITELAKEDGAELYETSPEGSQAIWTLLKWAPLVEEVPVFKSEFDRATQGIRRGQGAGAPDTDLRSRFGKATQGWFGEGVDAFFFEENLCLASQNRPLLEHKASLLRRMGILGPETELVLRVYEAPAAAADEPAVAEPAIPAPPAPEPPIPEHSIPEPLMTEPLTGKPEVKTDAPAPPRFVVEEEEEEEIPIFRPVVPPLSSRPARPMPTFTTSPSTTPAGFGAAASPRLAEEGLPLTPANIPMAPAAQGARSRDSRRPMPPGGTYETAPATAPHHQLPIPQFAVSVPPERPGRKWLVLAGLIAIGGGVYVTQSARVRHLITPAQPTYDTGTSDAKSISSASKPESRTGAEETGSAAAASQAAPPLSVPPDAVIARFDAEPRTMPLNSSFELVWNVADAQEVQIDLEQQPRTPGFAFSHKSRESSGRVRIDTSPMLFTTAGSYVFRLQAKGSNGVVKEAHAKFTLLPDTLPENAN